MDWHRSLGMFVAGALLPLAASAWNAEGHRAVGAVADRLIAGTRAQQQVARILGGWDLETVSVWADCVKGVASADGYNFKYNPGKPEYRCEAFEASPVEIDRMKAYAEANWKQCGTPKGSEVCHKQYHYADVSTLRGEYRMGYVGANTHDVVHAIQAAIEVLRGRPAPPPFRIADAREALMLLAHFAGDVHQPLHVGAIYLDAAGAAVDPDASGFSADNDTAGGNNVLDGSRTFHSEWDEIPAVAIDSLVATAARAKPSTGELSQWPVTWASDTMAVEQAGVLQGLQFHGTGHTGSFGQPQWSVDGGGADYQRRGDEIKRQQLAKAGARLAQVLTTLWPQSEAAAAVGGPTAIGVPCNGPAAARQYGYLGEAGLGDLRAWLPESPLAGSAEDERDVAEFFRTRGLIGTPRGTQAAMDDVYDPPLVARRFADALGARATDATLQALAPIIGHLEDDASNLIDVVKRKTCAGGRIRPFVRFPSEPGCLFPQDLAGHRDNDLKKFALAATGSYPSTHSEIGMLVALLLSEAAPERADALMQRGLEFGDSRVVCGFHYASDVNAGRIAAAAVFARVQSDGRFQADLAALRAAVSASRP